MKDKSKDTPSYQPFGKFVIRTPLFPIGSLGDPGSLLRTTPMQEALFVASPDLYECQQADDGSTRMALHKYMHRSSTRCTPFGLFAGCTMGSIAEQTATEFEGMDGHRKMARLDTECLCRLIGYLEHIPSIRENLKYYPNDTTYRAAGELRYLMIRRRKQYSEAVVDSVVSTRHLSKALKRAAHGATIAQIAGSVADTDIPMQDAVDYVNEMIGSQILRSELQPHAVGGDNMQALLLKLAKMPHHPLFDNIAEIQQTLEKINASPVGSSTPDYGHIATIMNRIGIQYDRKRLIQVDLHKKAEKMQISSALVGELTQAVNALMEQGGTNHNLTSFAQRFMAKFGGKPTPLATVLDKDAGIGYPDLPKANETSELLGDLAMPYRPRQGVGGMGMGNMGSMGSYSRRDLIMLEKYTDALAKGRNFVRIDDMIPANRQQRQLSSYGPLTFAVMCNLMRGEDGQETVYMHGIGGNCAANMLGRFAHIDRELGDFVQEIADYETALDKDKLFIEIAHLPDPRLGNVVMRPHIRAHVFNYMSNGNDNPRNIPLSDIMVTLQNGRVTLLSKKYGKQLIPRLTCAHAYNNSRVPVYRLLCDLQTQDGIWAPGWGNIFSHMHYRPRLQYKNIILSRQRWTVAAAEFKGCDTMTDDQLKAFGAKFIERHKIVRHVIFAQGDNEMYIDLLDPESIRILQSLTKDIGSFGLEEFIFGDDNSPVADKSGSYANEIIFCYKKTYPDE